MKAAVALSISALLASSMLLGGCRVLDGGVVDDVGAFVRQELDVEVVEVTDWRKSEECIAVDVTVDDGESYRVVLVNENYPDPQPFEALAISQIYTLEDFRGSTDSWCGLVGTAAYEQDKNGEARVLG